MEEENKLQGDCSNLCNYRNLSGECGNDISCFRKIAGTLTGEEIKRHGLIITEPNSTTSSFQATTYDLTLGEGHYVYNGSSKKGTEKWSLIFIGNDDRLLDLNNKNPAAEQYQRFNRDKPKTLVIPPYGSAFVQMNETVDTYTVAKDRGLLVVGRFDLKLSQVHQGLISQQATQVEPCYRGKLFCFIHNLSNQSIELKYGDKIATIEFSYVSCFCNDNKRKEIIDRLIKKNKEKYKSPFCSETGIDEVRYFHAEEQLPDDCGLLGWDERVKGLVMSDETIEDIARIVEKSVDKKAKWIPVIVSLITFIGLIITTIWNTAVYNKKLEEIESQLNNQQEYRENTSSKIEQLDKINI